MPSLPTLTLPTRVLPLLMRLAGSLFVLGILAVGAPDAVASPLVVTAEEEAILRAGEVVIRPLAAKTSGDVRIQAIVDVQAPNAAVWGALLDFPARLQSSSAVKSVEHYRPSTATEQWVKWHISKFGFEITYHNHYVLDRAQGRLSHELDAAQANDLAGSRGVYELHPSPVDAGWTRLAYECESNFGQAMPGFVQKWMSTSATRDFMTNMASRAQARASAPK